MALRTQKTTLATAATHKSEWQHIDGDGKVLGRLATRVATILMGKHKPTYTPHVDTGDFVVVTNCAKIKITGKKLDQTTYDRYSHYPSGLKRIPYRTVQKTKPELLLELAVRRMLPKSALGRNMLKKLKAYRGADHPHSAQQPKTIEL
jgi:large subunit ribosomal protein L13